MGQHPAQPVPDHLEKHQHLLQVRAQRPTWLSVDLPSPVTCRGRVRQIQTGIGEEEREDLQSIRCFQVGTFQRCAQQSLQGSCS